MKKSNLYIILFALLTCNTTNILTKSEKATQSARVISPLQQGDILDLSEFTEIYPPAFDKNGNIQTEPILSKTLKKGNGSKPVRGEMLVVHYTGCLPSDMISTKTMLTRAENEKTKKLTVGSPFDSSIQRGQPFQFKLGTGAVISGWDIVLADMKVGEKRIVILPAKQAYGNRATGKIPANATLIFEIELIEIA